MTATGTDLNLFRDFVLNPTEKAVLGAAILGLGRLGIEDTSKPEKKAERHSALVRFFRELLGNPELKAFEALFKHTMTRNDAQLTALTRKIETRPKKLLIRKHLPIPSRGVTKLPIHRSGCIGGARWRTGGHSGVERRLGRFWRSSRPAA